MRGGEKKDRKSIVASKTPPIFSSSSSSSCVCVCVYYDFYTWTGIHRGGVEREKSVFV